jgi:adenine-specific DNA-methyltransferase
LKPFFKNSNIERYYCNESPQKYLLYFDKHFKINSYPNIKKHLDKFQKLLKNRLITYNESYNWYELHRPRNESIFLAEKIIVPYRSKVNCFSYTTVPWFCRSDCYVLTKKDDINLKYILAILNSRLYYIWLYFKGKRKGEILELFQTPLSEIPIKKIFSEQQKPFIQLVDQILSITKDEDYLNNPDKQAKVKRLEKEIDKLVYGLYELTPEEIKIVEEFNNGN